MTVQELIKLLQEFPGDQTAKVVIDVTPDQEWPTLREIRSISKIHERDDFVIWLRR